MENPFFALKQSDIYTRRCKRVNTIIVLAPNAEYGMVTVFDEDAWIYAISKLQESINNHQLIKRTVYLTPYDFF
ncbi:replication initiator protein A [Candidatus Williamhamiltonella defendens]|uniref:replication initiator protein A n=1 Tax=Candidatus Williamhamiltonella defendens TaxID=138072 RepID=UPI0022A7259F|nr:replication initiator protein A [Candidatus Hamiltonella defensa]